MERRKSTEGVEASVMTCSSTQVNPHNHSPMQVRRAKPQLALILSRAGENEVIHGIA
jgi:hypothetical protein